MRAHFLSYQKIKSPILLLANTKNITQVLIETLDKILLNPEKYKLYPEMKHAKFFFGRCTRQIAGLY